MEGFAVNWDLVSGEEWGEEFWVVTHSVAYTNFFSARRAHGGIDPDFVYDEFSESCDKVYDDDEKNLKSNLYVLKECVKYAFQNLNPLIARKLKSILLEMINKVKKELEMEVKQRKDSCDAFQLCLKYNTERMNMSKDEVIVAMSYVDDMPMWNQYINDVNYILSCFGIRQ